MPVASRTGAKGAADREWSRIVRARAGGRCEWCGTPAEVQAAHIIGRSYSATRCDPDNGRGLCGQCHREVDTHVREWSDLIGAEELLRLQQKAKQGVGRKVDWHEVRDELRETRREMEAV